MNNFQEKLILSQLEQSKGKKVAFWGASTLLLEFLSKNSLDDYNIIGIIDNNKNIQGTTFLKYLIYSPENISEIPDNIIYAIENRYIKNYSQIKNWIENNWENTLLLPNIFMQTDIQSLASNKIYIVDENGNKTPVVSIPGLTIEWKGINSTIEIGANPLIKFRNTKIICGNNSVFKIGPSTQHIFDAEFLLQTDNSQIKIGKEFRLQGGKFWMSGEANKTIEIGDDCMFSHGIIIRSSDYHTLYSLEDKTKLNVSNGVQIGNHVWLCQNVTILKNAKIPNNCVIGASSIVNKAYTEENSVISGNPAKITKKNICWDRDTIEEFVKQKNL